LVEDVPCVPEETKREGGRGTGADWTSSSLQEVSVGR